MDDVFALNGPLEKVDGKFLLRIPLDAGGDEFIECSRGISEVQGECLVAKIPEWLAGVLRVKEGDLVRVSKVNGKFYIEPVDPRPMQ
jgi:hypothetical protein